MVVVIMFIIILIMLMIVFLSTLLILLCKFLSYFVTTKGYYCVYHQHFLVSVILTADIVITVKFIFICIIIESLVIII